MTEFLAIISGVFKFWDQVSWLVKLLQQTPEEKHDTLIASIQLEAEKFRQTGRPKWN